MERNKFPKTPSPRHEGFHPDEYPIPLLTRFTETNHSNQKFSLKYIVGVQSKLRKNYFARIALKLALAPVVLK